MTERKRKRSHGDGGLRERGPGAWEIKFYIGRDPVTGRRRHRYLTVHGSKRNALDELAKLQHQRSENQLLEPQRFTVGDYLEKWLTEHARHRVSPKTFERYAELMRRHVVPSIGHVALSKLTPSDIQACLSRALTTPRRVRLPDGSSVERPPLSPQTVKHVHRVLSQALKQAVRLRLVAHNPVTAIDPPRPVRRDMNILSPPQLAELIQRAANTAIYVPVALASTTGMRRGEVLALRWRDVDLDSGVLSVAQTLEETKAEGLRFKAPKTERSRRTIALPALTVELLRRHRIRQGEEQLRAGGAYTKNDLVCSNALGEPLRPSLVTGAFIELTQRLKLRVRFHDLRHTHLSHLLAAGVHPKVVSERAGHTSVAFTLDVYSHLIPGMQEDAANKIDAALRAHME